MADADLLSDPFGERRRLLVGKPMALLGAQVRFESNDRRLLELAAEAFAGLPPHRLARAAESKARPRRAGRTAPQAPPASPDLRVVLRLTPRPRGRKRSEPPPLAMLSGAELLAGAPDESSFVALSPASGSGLVVVPEPMLRFAYHTRYELIEFAVYTLAARTQGLAALHAACVGRDCGGVVLMGASGSGKSTVALHCLLRGLDFLSEDAVFVQPSTMLATGAANFLHVRSDTLRWLGRTRAAAAIRRSPVIRRRSGVRKFEVDLRRGGFKLARAPLKLESIVFLSARSAGGGSLLRPLGREDLLARLESAQAYAAGQPEWPAFRRGAAALAAFELRRGRDPNESVDALESLLSGAAPR
jgi:hypothetical protein